MKVNYRIFRLTDFKELKEMMKSLYIEDPGTETFTDKKAKKTLEVLHKEPERGSIVVFEKEALVIGYAILIYFWSNEFGGNILTIDEVYVKKKYRSQGVASGFIEYIKKSKFKNAVMIQLEVTPDNYRAMQLYERLGFQKYRNELFSLNLGD